MADYTRSFHVGAGDAKVSKQKVLSSLSDVTIHVKLKLSALWAATTLCYIYGDLFGFFRRATLNDISSGHGGFITTQTGLLVASLTVAIPSVMVVLSLLLKPSLSRVLNLVFGVAYTLIIVATMPGAWWYYLFLGVIECVLTLLVVWYAWHWPKEWQHDPHN